MRNYSVATLAKDISALAGLRAVLCLLVTGGNHEYYTFLQGVQLQPW